MRLLLTSAGIKNRSIHDLAGAGPTQFRAGE